MRCTYELDETFFQEIEKKESEFSISLNDYLDDDTIWVFQPTDIAFTVSTSQGIVRQAEVDLNNKVIFSTASAYGSFRIDGPNLHTGFYPITVRFLASAGTGSLADRLGAEGKIVWRTWVLAVDVTPPTPPVLQAAEQNGFFKLTWQPYRRKNFKKYIVIVQGANNVQSEYEINNPNRSFFIDSGNTGGIRLTYHVRTETPLHGVFSNPLTEESTVTMKIDRHPEDSSLVFRWTKLKYPAAVSSFTIDTYHDTEKITISASDTSDRVKIKAPVFMRTMYYRLRANSKAATSPRELAVVSALDPIGVRVKPGQKFFYSAGLQSMVGYEPGREVLRLYDKSFVVRDSFAVPSNFKVPFPGNHLFAPTSGGITHVDLISRRSVFLPYHASHANPSVPISFNASNSLRFSYTTVAPNGYYQAVVDGRTGRLISQWNVSYRGDADDIRVSPAGQFFSRYGKCYRIDPDTVFLGGHSSEKFFRPDKEDEMISLTVGVVIVRVNDPYNYLWMQFPDANYWSITYDPFSKNVLGIRRDQTTRYLMNIETGQTKPLTFQAPEDNEQRQVFLINGWLIHSPSGLCVRVL